MGVRITKNLFALEGAQEGTKKVILESCIKIRTLALPLMAVDKGQYKNSAMYKTREVDGGFNEAGGTELAPESHRLEVQPAGIEGYVGTNSDHWFSEFGTRYQAPQPAWRPAKELFQGATAQEIGIKYGKEEMARQFARRKKRVVNG
jgi:hypothetical protein